MKLRLAVSFLLLATLTACTSAKRLYPAAGATVGGGVGAIGGVGTAALGAAAGYAVGEVVAADLELAEAAKEVEKAKETIDALTRGDVEGLLAQRLQEAETSWGEKALKEIWGLLKLAGFVALALSFLFVAVPLLLHKSGIKAAVKEVKANLQNLPRPD